MNGLPARASARSSGIEEKVSAGSARSIQSFRARRAIVSAAAPEQPYSLSWVQDAASEPGSS